MIELYWVDDYRIKYRFGKPPISYRHPRGPIPLAYWRGATNRFSGLSGRPSDDEPLTLPPGHHLTWDAISSEAYPHPVPKGPQYERVRK